MGWVAVFEQKYPPGFRWLHESFGANWRLTEMLAAIGRIQLKWMADWTEKRQSNARKIWDCGRQFNALRVPNVIHQDRLPTLFGKSKSLTVPGIVSSSSMALCH